MKDTNYMDFSRTQLENYTKKSFKRKFYPTEFQLLKTEEERLKWAKENNIIYPLKYPVGS